MIGYWIDPSGNAVQVHDVPPHTHMGHALRILAELNVEPGDDAVMTLINLGWVRISEDVIQFRGLSKSRERVSRFVRTHADVYEQIGRVTMIDEKAGTERVVHWDSICD